MRKILVIQQKMIGDVLVSSILCETLAKAYPQARIDYLIYESTYPVIQENTQHYRVVLFTDKARKSKREFLRFAGKIRNEHYDVIVDAYSKLESWVIVAMSKAKKKISFKKGWTDFLYTDLVLRHKEPVSNLGLAIEHRLKLLEPLGIAKDLYVTRPQIKITEQEMQQALAVMDENQLNRDIPVAVVNILGSAASKTYPARYMAQIVDHLAMREVQILFNYMPRQAQQASEIFGLCKPETQDKVYLDVLNVDMRGFLALMGQCACIIGNDGGAMNMAKALGKPSLIIFSPWIDKQVWATFEDGVNHVSVHLQDFYPQWFTGKTQKVLRKQAQALYAGFKPELFLRQVDDFCRKHLDSLPEDQLHRV